ncbi:MAG TPA: hypothetical protein ENF64_00725, partial [Hadesarchaea archaeon]|nr:hypothetical protein [Hadesarchaea archaeon]
MKHVHLANIHRSLGAQLVDFAGWEMPLKYSSIAEEHLAVRKAAGLFDVSHMGELDVRGSGAIEFLQRLTSNDVARLEIGEAQYSTVLNEAGGVMDDVLVYRTGKREFIVVCNAVNVEKINGWFSGHRNEEVIIRDISATTVLLALQGPRSQQILQPLTTLDLT